MIGRRFRQQLGIDVVCAADDAVMVELWERWVYWYGAGVALDQGVSRVVGFSRRV